MTRVSNPKLNLFCLWWSKNSVVMYLGFRSRISLNLIISNEKHYQTFNSYYSIG